MEKSNTAVWFRVLALCTAVGLGGAYVWSRQKVAEVPKEAPEQRTVLSGSKSAVFVPDDSFSKQVESDRVLMPSSKSGVVLPKDETPRVLMPSSKSLQVVFPERHDSSTPAEQKTDEP